MREKIYSATLENLNILIADNNWQLLGMCQALNIFCLHHFSWSSYSRLQKRVFINLFIICSGWGTKQSNWVDSGCQASASILSHISGPICLKLMKYFTGPKLCIHASLCTSYIPSTCTSAQSKAFAVNTQLVTPFLPAFSYVVSPSGVWFSTTLSSLFCFWELSCPHRLKMCSMFTDTVCSVYQDLFSP